MLLSPLGLLFHEFFHFIFVFSALNIRLMTQLEQPRPTMQTCFSTCSLRSFLQASILSFHSLGSSDRATIGNHKNVIMSSLLLWL
jgi:hypothetical protein